MERIGLELAGEPSVGEMMAFARRAEELGCDSIWLTETRFTRDAVTTAAAVATATSRARVGTAVVNPYTRGAVLMAVTLATLDELANGRIVFGIGPGSPVILDRQGIVFDRPLARLREYVEVIRRLLIGESVTYRGATVGIHDVRLDFRPRRSSIPVYLGVTGPRALALAGEIADGVILNGFVSVDYTRRAVERVHEGARSAGRPANAVDIAASIVVSIDADGDRARDAVRPLVATYLADFPNIARESRVPDVALTEIRAAYERGGAHAAAPLVSNEIVDELTCAGTVAECRRAIDARCEAGVRLPILSFASGNVMDALEALTMTVR